MNSDLIVKIERAASDRDFFLLNKESIISAFEYVQNIYSKYVDICCMKFTSFSPTQTSYAYGSVITLAASFIVAKNKFFINARGNAMDYMINSFFDLLVDEYNSGVIVTDKTQLHMLKGTIDEYTNSKYVGGEYDSLFIKEYDSVIKWYLNDVISYCADRKKDGFTKMDVAKELLPLLNDLF